MKAITVFATSSEGNAPEYAAAAENLGLTIASRGYTLVYGANRNGLAGTLARAAKGAGGRVIGVMPRFLVDQGKAFDQLDEFHVAKDLHEHKARMAELGDAFIALPGGLGTLEEFFEALTWAQLRIHNKPCGLYNVCGFYNQLQDFLDQVRDSRFIDEGTRNLIIVSDDADELLDRLVKFRD